MDKWNTLRLLLEQFEREARDKATDLTRKGMSRPADKACSQEQSYQFILGKMAMLDSMEADLHLPPKTEDVPASAFVHAVPEQKVVTVAMLFDEDNLSAVEDAVNEMLRERQRDFDSKSSLIDYAFVGTDRTVSFNLSEYNEGDFLRTAKDDGPTAA